MRAWLKREAGPNLWYDSPAGPGLERVRFPKNKPNAEIYIDDRGYRFSGTWPDLDEVMAWKPWNKTAAALGIRKARESSPPSDRVPFDRSE